MPRILLGEDNGLNCDLLSRHLQRRGYDVLLAADGAQGVALAWSAQPDLILLDMNLPLLNDWEATQQLKSDPATCQIPVIALTAPATSSDREQAERAGCDDDETKPLDFPRLLSKIVAALALRSAAR